MNALIRRHVTPSRRMPLLVYAWAQVVLLCWWAVDFPAQLSRDSITYMHHVTIGPWVADHSVLYDFTILCSLRLTGDIWLITLAQTVVYAALLALIASRVRALGVRARWAALPALIIVFLPPFGSFITMLWKDVPFAAANMLLAATLLKVIRDHRAGLPTVTWQTVAAIAAELLAIALFRNNGFVVVILVAAGLILALRGSRLKMLAAGAAAIVAFEFAGAVVYPAAGILPVSSTEAYGVFYGDIALVYGKDPGAFTPAQLAVMKKVAPLSHWKSSNNCLDSDSLFRGPFDKKAAVVHRYQLADVWFSLLKTAPANLIDGHMCRSAVAWRVRPTSGFSGVPTKTPSDLYGKHLASPLAQTVTPHPVSWRIYNLASHVRHAFLHTQPLQTIFYRAAGWTYLTYLAVIVAALRNRWKLIALAALPILANQLTVIAANPAQLYRYTVVQLFLGMLFVPLITAIWPRRTSRGDTDRHHRFEPSDSKAARRLHSSVLREADQ